MFQHMQHLERTISRRVFTPLACLLLIALAGASDLKALTLTGTVTNGKYVISGSPVNVSTNSVLKISFETTTSGDALMLCAGSLADVLAGHCAINLNGSGGPGYMFLTIIDAASLNGKVLYVIRDIGIQPASFRLTIE